MYPEGYDYSDDRQTPEPGNLDGVYQRLPQSRPSLSPSRFTTSNFRDLKRKNNRVIDEGEVMRDVLPIICGNSDIPNKQNLLFTRLDPIANNTTVDAKPDFYDGARLQDIDPQVRQDLGSYIIPTGHRTAPVAPNFFMEAKAPKGGADVAKRQACYDGALGARAMHKLQSYKTEPVYDSKAYTVTSTYHAGTGSLKLYTTHPTQAEDGSTEYHMTQYKGWDLTSDPETFRQGATAFRNARDWAKEQRDRFISAANERARSINAEPTPSKSSEYIVSDTTYVQDTTYLTQAQDLVDSSQHYTSQQNIQGGYESNEPSTFQPSAYNGASVEASYIYTQPSPFQSSEYNGYSDTMNTYPVQESETSADELTLETYVKLTASDRRRSKGSEKTTSKAPRHGGGKSGRRHRSKR